MALDKEKNAIGIVLSGTGSDGTLGIRAIKEAGGLVMVQDEESAKFNGMPRSAISTGIVDYILPSDKMAAELLNYISHPSIEDKRDILEQDENNPSRILGTIIDITQYKDMEGKIKVFEHK